MPTNSLNTIHCLILESKASLREIPPNTPHYFINSKRRFFVYFKHHEHMLETMRILTNKHVRFYPRESIFPDREELEEHVYHCNYRFKKQDLRKNLYHTTPYNEPRTLFDKYDTKEKNTVESKPAQEQPESKV